MNDHTYSARIERAVASLEIILGRLERLTGSLAQSGGGLPIQAPSDQPPLSPEDEKAIDAIIERRKEEQLKERDEEREYVLGD